MSESLERPLVTFALFAYNQERFIREAVEGAFAQEYSPLEIILSDDNSSDETFSIMQQMAANYHGKHRVRLNRNSSNLGIAGHVNQIIKLTRTDFLVVAAGDDISLPNRVDVLTGEWISSEKKAKSIYSLAEDISIHGVSLGFKRQGSEISKLNSLVDHAKDNLYVLGATHAWDMDIFRLFPPLNSNVVNEDVVLPVRAAIIGEVHLVPSVLVMYRTGVGISHEAVRRVREGKYLQTPEMLRRPYSCFVQKSKDFKYANLYKDYQCIIKIRRAESLMAFWLCKQGRLTFKKLSYFLKRTRATVFVKEMLRWKFPWLVQIKQEIQFKLVTKV